MARPKSLITGEDTKITWSANWDDNLGGATEIGHLDPIVEKVRRESEDKIQFEFEQTFMFYLPRICEHCLNPSCMASCPSGAIYKRPEDGIVLVDQDRCRGWRQCITGCPYKKIYFNHKSGKAEKCTFCYPRIEVGLPTVCSETCVGRLRYLGLFLYDADRVTAAAVDADEKDLYEAQLDLLLDPNDPAVIAAARATGIPEDWLDAARRSPVYALAKTYRVALPLHPEYRTMPMVWYVPPLSPVVDLLREQGHDAEDRGTLFGAIDALRIPVEYLAELFTAGDTDIVTGVLQQAGRDARLHARHHARTASRTTPSRRRSGMTGRDDLRDVPADGDREVRRALRHPERARRAGATSSRSSAARWTSTRARACTSPARSARQRPAGAGRRRDVPRPQAAADLREAAPASSRLAAGSTCSTGTATERRPGCSRTRRTEGGSP